ncbi:hypothetical protein [Bartonella sp. B17]
MSVETEGKSGGVRAWYHDIQAGEKKSVTIGSPPYCDLRYTYHNEDEAKSAIKTYQDRSLRGEAKFSCDIGGNPNIMAEAVLRLNPAFRPYIPREWRIKTVKHKIDALSGFVTSLECEVFAGSHQSSDDLFSENYKLEDSNTHTDKDDFI